MNKLFFIFSLLLLTISCSIDKLSPEPIVINGVDGSSSLAKVTNVAPGVNCANGGTRLDFGLDVNQNGMLDDDEIQNTAYTCNGINGKDGIPTLVKVTPVNGTVECAGGGVLVTTGVDKNGNGVLDPDEMTSSASVCSGIDGKSSTVKTEDVPATSTSPGGTWLHFYENNILINSVFVSNGKNGTDGINGIDGINGKDGVSVTITTKQVEDGYYLYITSATGTETIFLKNGTDGLNGTNGINGTNGTDGVSSTIRTEKVDPSFQYPYGGYFLYITVGTETQKIFVSNGANGTNGLNGTNGTNGTNGISTVYKVVPNYPDSSSSTIKIGYDTNGNGVLDTNEVIDNVVVSNGINGTNGTNGTNGLDGINSFIYVYTDVPAELCEFGGYVVVTGMDTNRNGILDESEKQYTYICDCGCGGDDDSQKVALCHKTKIGNDWKYVTLYVPQSAVQAHLDHGDNLGKCN